MTSLRITAALAALPLTGVAAMIIFGQIRYGLDWFQLILGSTAGTLAILCWSFALGGHHPETRRGLRYALKGGLLLGAASFVVGFVGPIIVTPEANQGPLLGLFFTGPAGFVAGVGLGALYSLK